MSIDRIVEFNWNRLGGKVGFTSQDEMVILTDDTPAADGDFGAVRMKRYAINSLETLKTDFSSSAAAYLAAQKIAGLQRKIKYIYVAKRDAAVQAVVDIVFDSDPGAGDTITGSVNGTAISEAWDSDVGTTLGNIATAIAAAWGVASAVSNGTDTITVTATSEYLLTVGAFTAAGGNAPDIDVTTDTAGRTITDDIDDMFAEDDTPYLVYQTSVNSGAIESATVNINGREKSHFAATNDATVPTAATTDIASRLKAAGYWKTALFYTEDTTKHIPAALAGYCLSFPSGSIAFSNVNLTGIAGDDLTAAEIAFLEGKYVNQYAEIVSDTPVVLQGVTMDNSQIHTVRDQHTLMNRFNVAFMNKLIQDKKPSLTQKNLLAYQAEGENVVSQAETDTILDSEYDNTFTAPLLADIPDADTALYIASGFYGDLKIENVFVKIQGTIDARVA